VFIRATVNRVRSFLRIPSAHHALSHAAPPLCCITLITRTPASIGVCEVCCVRCDVCVIGSCGVLCCVQVGQQLQGAGCCVQVGQQLDALEGLLGELENEFADDLARVS
jgi:hypothetical protein